MRTISATITSYEAGASLQPSYSLIASNELLSFSLWTTQANASLDATVPQTIVARNGGTYAYATHRYADGTTRAKVMTLGTAAGWAMTGGAQVNANTVLVMRNGLITEAGGTSYLYTATASGSAIQLRRQTLSGTTDPPTISLSNWGVTFGSALTDTSSLVRRVEAICPTDGGVIVAVGTHDFANDRSTIQFYWHVDNATCYQLDTLIQAPLTDAYTDWSSHWYGGAKWATFVSATYNSTTGAVVIVANAHPSGKAVSWTIKNGVESMPLPCAPVDPQYGGVTFRPSGLSVINSAYYLAGRITYTYGDGSTTAFDCYLTSSDGVSWSVGERNYYLQAGDSMGALVVDTASSPVYIYYGGNLAVSRATATPAQGYNTATLQTTVTTRLQPGWSISQSGNAANTFNCKLANADAALTGSSVVTNGALLYLQMGHWGTTSAIGTYSIDAANDGVHHQAGRLPTAISSRDVASKTLIRHNAPVDVAWWGQDSIATTLATMEGLAVKTREGDIYALSESTATGADLTLYDNLTGASGLQHKGLNNPLVAYADVQGAPSGLMKATVTMPDTGSAYAIPSFTFLLNADDAGAFNGVVIPKAASWEAKTTPRVVRSNLAPYSESTDTGGFDFEARYQGWWESNNYDAGDADLKYLQAVLEQPSHYNTETAYTHTAGQTRDYACRVQGRRVQLFHKLHDYAAATCAGNALYTLITEYLFTDDAQLSSLSRTRPGFAVACDTWASKTAYPSAAYADIEKTLSAAASYQDAAHYNTSALPPGVTQWDGNSAGTMQAYNGASPSTTDLRNYFYVGQQVSYRYAGSAYFVTIASIAAPAGYYNRIHFTGPIVGTGLGLHTLWIKSGTYWASASSGVAPRTYTVAGDTLTLYTDPQPVRASRFLTGRGAFVGNDLTTNLYAPRWIDSDGVSHFLMDAAWDATNPISSASEWKLVMHQNAIMKAYASDSGLATTGHMMIDHEAVRYGQTSVTQWGENLDNNPSGDYANTTKLTHIPTYYATPATQATASTTIQNKFISTDRPGDDLGAITDAAGLLVEISGRGGGDAVDEVPPIYVVSNGYSGSVGQIIIDTTLDTPVTDAEFITVSGRAQLGTRKAAHASDAAVCNCPVPVGGSMYSSLVTVSRFDAYMGLRRSTEDAIRYLCAFAGMRSPAFRAPFTSTYNSTDYTAAITTTPTALPFVKNVADFVLDMSVHIDSSAVLCIAFRTDDSANAYYQLRIYEPSPGVIDVGLAAPGSDLTASGGVKWLERAQVPINAGKRTCATATVNANLRVSVQGATVSVDINGQPLWVFNLAAYVHTDGTSYANYTAYTVALSYTSSVASNSATIHAPELFAAVDSVTMRMGENTSSVLKRICNRSRIVSRPTATGGLTFSQWQVRDADATALTKSLREHGRSADDSAPLAHVQVSGQQSGGFINGTFVGTDGYSFALVSDSTINSVQAAADAAQLRARDSLEFAGYDELTGSCRLSHEVEDKVTLSYTPSGDAPAQASKDMVITSLEWSGTDKAINARWKLRDYTAWQ